MMHWLYTVSCRSITSLRDVAPVEFSKKALVTVLVKQSGRKVQPVTGSKLPVRKEIKSGIKLLFAGKVSPGLQPYVKM